MIVASLQGEPRPMFYRLILNVPVNRRGLAMNLASDREIYAHFDCSKEDRREATDNAVAGAVG